MDVYASIIKNRKSERIVMYCEAPEFEVLIKGHSIVKVADGGIRIDGRDFHSDLKNLSALVGILNEVLETAEEVKKPRLVA